MVLGGLKFSSEKIFKYNTFFLLIKFKTHEVEKLTENTSYVMNKILCKITDSTPKVEYRNVQLIFNFMYTAVNKIHKNNCTV